MVLIYKHLITGTLRNSSVILKVAATSVQCAEQ